MMDEIVERLPDLTKEEITLLDAALHRERQRRASATGEAQDSPEGENPAPLVTEVLEYRPHEDGYLQLELRRYPARRLRSRAWPLLVFPVPRGRQAPEALPRQDR